jgi:hypothetical protein
MSAADDSASAGELERYRNQARDIRALIESGVLSAPQTIEDLRQLAAWYEALAEHHSPKAKDPTGPLPAPSSADETAPSDSGGEPAPQGVADEEPTPKQ